MVNLELIPKLGREAREFLIEVEYTVKCKMIRKAKQEFFVTIRHSCILNEIFPERVMYDHLKRH